MDDKRPEEQQEPTPPVEESPSHTIKMKTFSFIMLVFLLIIATAGLTVFALTFGDEKAVEVNSPERREFEKLYTAYDQIQDQYYKDVDRNVLVNGAINGMVDSLDDPYSDYLDEEEASQFLEGISSSFQGIGAEVQERGGFITVVSPIKNSPAEKAGILPNDQIIAVDGDSIQGYTTTEAVMLIRGEKGTEVTLTVKRGENADPIDITIVRDEIPIETVYAEMIGDNVAHIQVTSFSENTYQELLDAIKEMEDEGMEALVMDVRGNPGGLLNVALDISDLFIEEGKPLFEVQAKGEEPEIYTSSSGTKIKVPVTLLIDGGSASASEILAGAMNESADIQLVGEKTFGKGTVQTANDLQDGSNLKFTTAKWLTPDGNWIHEKGIEPDVEVGYPAYASLPVLDTSIELKDGTISEQVKTAEQMLEALGYDVGEVDGVFEEQMTEAVKAFQEEKELEATGVLTEDSTFAVMDALREKIKNDDPQLQEAKKISMEEAGITASEPEEVEETEE
ncbi:carboxy-terminal processing protease [Planococcus donghaensis MPA1U2]|uniref:Carboxy-terminal processing protease n=1 Tax=Planococcus donghaensis MPA1U2 TaxID=933115 RepID=E7RJ64_9BACL|nr:S41 family peptidase [Planococcus donghaensis]EGA88959.1 carboxy-terminal processing protease [Planococcus donghaensis MPA1U2]